LALGEVKALLTALKVGIEASAAGVFDTRRGDMHASSEMTLAAFWDAFGVRDCWDVDWGDWDRELLASNRARVSCGCGVHSVRAFLVHDRWVLLVLAGGPLMTGAETVISHALKILVHLLPRGRAGRSAPPRPGGAGPAELGIPVWWVRRRIVS
jgi:hypothetical protein